MVQTVDFVNNNKPLAINLISGQYAILNVPDDGIEYRFDIAPNDRDAPVLELVPLANRTIPLRPEIMSIIPEGSTYKLNVWDVTDFDLPQRVATGSINMAVSIATLALDYTTTFFRDEKTVYLTKAEYDQLVADGEVEEGTTYRTTEEGA